MACAEVVIHALRTLEEARKAPFLTNRVKLVFASRKDLVRIRLVPSIDHDLVMGRVEDVVQSNRKLNSAESSAEVASNFCDRVYEILANFVADAPKFCFRKLS
jgi:hypothetical protein